MRKMLSCSLLVALVPNLAVAAFIDNYSDWQAYSPNMQSAYVTGLVDAFVNSAKTGEQKWVTSDRLAILDCSFKMSLTPDMIRNQISEMYKQNTKYWGTSPSIIFGMAMYDICHDAINKRRLDEGIDPINR